eukprot:5452691-Pyramimonas_sp.AAC.1
MRGTRDDERGSNESISTSCCWVAHSAQPELLQHCSSRALAILRILRAKCRALAILLVQNSCVPKRASLSPALLCLVVLVVAVVAKGPLL